MENGFRRSECIRVELGRSRGRVRPWTTEIGDGLHACRIDVAVFIEQKQGRET